MKFNVAIIGGGIVGTAIARELSKYDISIILIEKEIEASFGTSKANSGIIHSSIHDDPNTLKGKLCLQGNSMWDQISKEMKVPFKRVGELLVARTDEDIPTLKDIFNNAKARKIPAEIVEGEKLWKLEPNLSRDIKLGLLAPTAGVIPPYEMTYALLENAIQNDVFCLLESKVTGIKQKGSEFAINAGRLQVQADYIVNSAGVHADEIAAMVGANNFKINPRKGEEYLLDKRLDNINNHIIFPTPTKTSKGILIIKTIEGSTMIGPTAIDVTDKEDTSTSNEGLNYILDFVRTMVPGINKNDIIASFAGIRPVADTNDFIIEESKMAPHFVNAAGIQSPGLTAAPAIALMVADILRDSGLKMNKKKDFVKYDKPHRRLTLSSTKDKELLFKLNNNFGNIVCRCETVSEAEVVGAIENGARSVDGVKLRTRAGMGRCQSGFCLHHVMKILARELDLPEDAITKRGGGSYITKKRK